MPAKYIISLVAFSILPPILAKPILACPIAIADDGSFILGGFTTLRVIKSMPNYPKRKTSFGEKLFSFLSTVAKSLIPIYNIITLIGLLFCDRQEMIERVKADYYAEMGE